MLYFDDCPNWRDAAALIDRLASEYDDVVVTRTVVDTADEAVRLGFVGSPTILIDGVDPWADGGATPGLSCRLFATGDGSMGLPTWEQLERAARSMGAVSGSGIG